MEKVLIAYSKTSAISINLKMNGFISIEDKYSKTPLSRHPRLPPDFSFVRNKLLYKVYAVRHRHPPTVFNVPMYLK